MSKHLISWLVLSAFFLGIACSNSPPSRHYYTIDYLPRKVQLEGSGRPYPFRVQLKRFEVLRMYDRSQIVFRYSPNELKYYQYRNWAMKPGDIIMDRAEAHLLSANLFDELRREFLDSYPDYRLEGTVDALEKYDGGDIFYAHLAMTVRLIRQEDAKEVWRYAFDQRKKVYEQDMVYTVIALREILETEMIHVIKELDRIFREIMGQTGEAPSNMQDDSGEGDESIEAEEVAPKPKGFQIISAKRDTVRVEPSPKQ
ncbi:MAG: ABC-type transport auxiliary lipoprotein family protein [Candidatus Latescibacterota bacterium]